MVGGGAREHTLVWKLAQSPKVKEIYAAPGNAGTARLAQNLDIKAEDIESLEKNISVRVAAGSNLTGNAILLGILVLLILAIGVVSVRVSRR